jgi:hypothetical protein
MLGSGWAEYPDPRANPRTCSEFNLLSRRELIEWPGPDETRTLAFGFGAWIEDCWGSPYSSCCVTHRKVVPL